MKPIGSIITKIPGNYLIIYEQLIAVDIERQSQNSNMFIIIEYAKH